MFVANCSKLSRKWIGRVRFARNARQASPVNGVGCWRDHTVFFGFQYKTTPYTTAIKGSKVRLITRMFWNIGTPMMLNNTRPSSAILPYRELK